MEYSAGRRVVLLFTAVVVVGILAFLLVNREGREEIFDKNLIHQDEGVVVLSSIDVDRDSDLDGLKDWQEALWQTNKYESDTDGDGTSDGDEVENGRDPLNGGLDDTLDLSDYRPSDSFTQQVSQNLYSQYSILKQENVEVTQDTRNTLIESSLLNNNLTLDVNVYTFNDVDVDPEYTNYREYADEMGQLLVSNSPKIGEESVVEITQRSLVEKRPEILFELDAHERRYIRFIDSALGIKVPFLIAEDHLLLINSLESTRAGISGISEADTDPLKGVVSLSVYNDSIQSSANAIANIRSFYESNGITFEQGEAGYVFLYGL